MEALLVGADSLGNIPEVLRSYDIRIARHICGRNVAHQRRAPLPGRPDLLILLTDFLGHNVMRNYRDSAAALGIPVLACRRSATAVEQRLRHHGWRRLS
ncbi:MULTISPECIES: DUF2325 domain-containing protein [Chromobacterium]|jgi:hypothetical protein|uniref:DUF2325 domain-containing protein n=2 Tax=Chromobacterium TaxID=535 RepID=A0A1S1WUM6_9NEIS|nr:MULTISPECIES: DUF2325 domain-containing protein [Chromobacterium]KIA80244.1 hypothetical protein QR66_11440 [Chromobacterium piscinae]MBM2885638.1 DUF2325 domain-containing protein [Chromobacterium amazonense]MDE1713992.1 DUF2325 domain-containing protein [Chromobacterium amazonense]MDQ4539550.1 DUF2325 domain-containing protein [Chromobacterium amazonense]OHX10592.1 hypothetical protein BI343_06375 [Chromobacterium amazonense]